MPKYKKIDFCSRKIPKSLEKYKTLHQKKILSDLVIKQLNLLVFMTMLLLYSPNWCFHKKKWFQIDFKVIWYTMMYFWTFLVNSESHCHIGTSLVDLTGFNGGHVGLFCWAKFVCLSVLVYFGTPFTSRTKTWSVRWSWFQCRPVRSQGTSSQSLIGGLHHFCTSLTSAAL